jgi:hypothetical protein
MKQTILFALLGLALFSTACGQASSDSELKNLRGLDPDADYVNFALAPDKEGRGEDLYFFVDGNKVLPWFHEAPNVINDVIYFRQKQIGNKKTAEICSGDFLSKCDLVINKDAQSTIVLRTDMAGGPPNGADLTYVTIYESGSSKSFAKLGNKIYLKTNGNVVHPWLHSAPRESSGLIYLDDVPIGKSNDVRSFMCTGDYKSVCVINHFANKPYSSIVLRTDEAGKLPLASQLSFYSVKKKPSIPE